MVIGMEISFGIYPEGEDEEVKEGEEEDLLKTVEEELERLRKKREEKGATRERKKKGPERVSTGVKQLDKVLKGGYPLGSIITISGDVGSGKSILGMQFLMDGINNDENVMYISFEERKVASLRHMKELGWNLPELEEESRLIFVEFPVDEIEPLIIENDTIRKMITQSEITRIIIDPITILGLLYEKPLAKRKTLIKFIERVRGWHTTTLLIAEDSRTCLDGRVPRSISGIESLTDGYIYLGYERRTGMTKRERYLEIIKMRGVEYDNKILPFTIGGKGFVITKLGRTSKKRKRKGQ